MFKYKELGVVHVFVPSNVSILASNHKIIIIFCVVGGKQANNTGEIKCKYNSNLQSATAWTYIKLGAKPHGWEH